MKYPLVSLLAALILMPCALFAQKPEPQSSFARSPKPHAYYVEQAELWWREVEKNGASEENWYNYFRACRNAHGTADWKSDFVKESPYLKPGPEIVALMREKIPNTFTYYYLSYLDGGIGTDNGENLMKAYRMNPHFEGIHSSVVSYAVSSGDTALRRRANREWYPTNYISDGLLTYGYNVLMSLEPNAILLTQQDNDTYPLWMLQDALGIREDVMVINIDFFLLKEYRDRVFRTLRLDSMNLEVKSADDYQMNWRKVVGHILTTYGSSRPLYVGMTLFQDLYDDFADRMVVSGLAFRVTQRKGDLLRFNTKLYEELFLLDYLSHRFVVDPNQMNVDYQNLNYINTFKVVYDGYRKAGRKGEAEKVAALAHALAEKVGDGSIIEAVEREFNERPVAGKR